MSHGFSEPGGKVKQHAASVFEPSANAGRANDEALLMASSSNSNESSVCVYDFFAQPLRFDAEGNPIQSVDGARHPAIRQSSQQYRSQYSPPGTAHIPPFTRQ